MNGRKSKHYSVLEVLNFSNIGMCWQFYSTKESDFIVSALSKCISKNIVLTNECKYEPSYSNTILLKEYEAKKSRYQLKIASENYHAILPIVDSVSKWLSENTQTAHDTNLKVSLSFNHRHLDTLESISQMNPTRLVLKFDENFIYSRFPEQKYSPYALSIKTLSPISTYVNESDVAKNIDYMLTLPAAKYYGIDFSNYTQGILEYNYIGGKNYPKKLQEIKEILEYIIIKTYQSLNEDAEFYTAFEMEEMKRITEGFSKIQMSYYDPDIFLKEFENIKLFIDLKTSTQTIKSFWTTLRKPLFEMILNGHLREGQFNYDTEVGKFQLRKGKVGGTLLKNIDFIKCEITGVLENCTFMNCNVVNSRVYNSKFIDGNKLINSYAEAVSINKHNEVTNSYIINTDEVINCPIKESVIKFATVGRGMTLDENSTIIVKQEALPKKTEAVQVETIRDYSWIKSLRKDDYKDEGFQNKYNKDTYSK
jgi:RNA binding exosome subunit